MYSVHINLTSRDCLVECDLGLGRSLRFSASRMSIHSASPLSDRTKCTVYNVPRSDATAASGSLLPFKLNGMMLQLLKENR